MADRPPISSDVASGPPPEEFGLDSVDDAWMHHIRQAEAVAALGTLGETHRDTLSAMNNLARLLRSSGRLEEAEAQAREAVKLGRKVLPPDHWMIGAILMAQGTTLMDMERYKEAEPILAESLSIIQGAFGEDHPNTTKARANLNTLYTRWNKPDVAAECASKGE